MSLRRKRVLVTGGAGFIGSHLVRRLLAERADVTVQLKYNSVVDAIRLAPVWRDVRTLEADLRNPDSLNQIRTLAPELIYHLAAYNHVGDSFLHVAEALDSNAKGSANLLEAYEDYERFVYVSTSEVYGYQTNVPFHEEMTPAPLSPYAVGKYGGELFARLKWRSLRRPVVVLRPFNAFGPYQSARAVVAETIITCLRGDELVTTSATQTRDFNYVENLVDAFVAVGTMAGIEGQTFNVGSGEEISIRDLVHRIRDLCGSTTTIRVGGLPDRDGEIPRMCADSTKARQVLSWAPRTDLDTGLGRTIAWYRDYLDVLHSPDSALWRLGLGVGR
ncbi:MAG: GDP-mannose 4,6-dehydratase [Acidobacteriota bacterium]